MKKAVLFLTMAALLLCSACGGSEAVPVAGTWYSVTDTTMYNFTDGEIKASGVTVGQYEDNGDSVVISMMNDGSNMKLYVTTMGEVDVLADVKDGQGNIYFCKGLENAQKIKDDTTVNAFKAYLDENLIGKWEVMDVNDEDAMDSVIFSEGLIQTVTGEKTADYPCTGVEYGMSDGEPYATFSVYYGGKEENAITITITHGCLYPERDDLYMDDDRWLIKSQE